MSDIIERLLKEKEVKDFIREYYRIHQKVNVKEVATELKMDYEFILNMVDSLIKMGDIPPLTNEEPIQVIENHLIKYINGWKAYPDEQWRIEEEIERVIQSSFRPPRKCKCGGKWHKVLTKNGYVYICHKCGLKNPVASHRVFWTNDEETVAHGV